jgi:streptomycin 6-kinase
VVAILDHITQQIPSDARNSCHQYRKAPHSNKRRAARDKDIKVLQGRIHHGNLDNDDDIVDIADQLTGDYW